jgi:Ni/Co efflux regulator RcnB
MLKTWNGRALAMAAGVALAASAPTARAEVAGGVIGCDASGNKQIAGALIGGVIGGVAGNNIIKKDQQAGTIVGATAGAAAGSYVGCNMQKKDAERAYAPPPRVVYEAPPSPPPPPARVRYYEEAPPTYVVREPPPRTVVYEEAPPPPPRNVYVQERYDDDDWDDDHWKHKRYKYRPDPRWARDAYYVPRGHGKRYLIGERMPVTYVRREYVIYEPARYRLRPAPVGYSWVMYGGDAYLVGTQTGLVAQIVRAILG